MAALRQILVVDDEPALADSLAELLGQEGYACRACYNAQDALREIRKTSPRLILSDVRMPGLDGIGLVKALAEEEIRVPVILTTAYGTTETAIEAMKYGAFDYLEKPFTKDSLLAVVTKALEAHRVEEGTVGLEETDDAGGADRRPTHRIVGSSTAMQAVYKQIGTLAGKPVTVLIRGETGSGKELMARAIYQHSERVHKPFIAVNCMAIPKNLLESELFGHERGAFTGANARRIGRFEQARQGTIFLDEIGDLEPDTQSKLLRVMQEKVIQRVGSNEDITIDTRVIAATHVDLERAVAEGRFRQDLFYRLCVAEVRIPPMRERREDIPQLVRYFLRRHASELGAAGASISRGAMQLLEAQPWPGNVRELENVVRKAILGCRGLPITEELVRGCLYQPPSDSGGGGVVEQWIGESLRRHVEAPTGRLYLDLLERMESHLFKSALAATGGNKAAMSKLLGLSRTTIYQKLEQYKLGA